MKTDTKKGIKVLFHILFWVYFLIAIRFLIFKYPAAFLKSIADNWNRGVILSGLSTANFVPLKTIKMYIRYADRLNSFENIVGNIVIFMPFGFLVPFTWKKNHGVGMIFALGFIFSMGVELTQLISGFGAFDVDDLILNTLGAILGYFVYKIIKKLFKKIN